MTTYRLTPDDELARRLEAYAQLRLSPSPDAIARMRARVLAAASAASVSVASAAPVVSHRVIPFRAPRFVAPRRISAALLAAALSALMVTGVALAATAGGPLYGVRMWVESVTLPSAPDARADAELDRLEARIEEVLRAAGNGNGGGISAALAAYDDILSDAVDAATHGSAGHAERLTVALNRHRAVLTDLLDQVPAQARDAIELAIERSSKATPGAGGSGNHGNGNNGGGNSGGNGNGNGNGNAGGNNGGNGKPDARPSGKPYSKPDVKPSRGGPGNAPGAKNGG